MIIRSIQREDAELFLLLCRQLDSETQFMLLAPDERATTPEEQIKYIDALAKSDNQTILVAEVDSRLVGFLAAMGGRFERNHHTASIVVGVTQAFMRQGIARSLLERLYSWAHEKNLHRLELSVMTHNDAAIALYKQMGFQVEGVRSHAIKIDGRHIDEYYMAKLLDIAESS